MTPIDWVVLVLALAGVVAYGIWRSRHIGTSKDFLAGKRDLPWWTIGLSIMATQASAITFLSTPGQGFADGMEFAQFYFGMPIAMLILVAFVLPVYYRLRVTTAYEYLEHRFDRRMRTLTALLFLIQRGVAAAISIYAPSIVLCAVFGWNLALTNALMAVFVIIYTTSGGSAAVSRTQELQMSIMLGGLVLAFIVALSSLPEGVGLPEAWMVAGATGKTRVVDWSFDVRDRYNIWSGILGATFLFLSYFGTDQSQVGRYLSGKSLRESRVGLLFNGFVKIPMQLLVLAVGVMVYVFFQFNPAPLYFHEANRAAVRATPYETAFQQLEARNDSLARLKQATLREATAHLQDGQLPPTIQEQLKQWDAERKALHQQAEALVKKARPDTDPKDKDFVFIHFILRYVPVGLTGLMLAMIFCASWSTTASELSALTATSVSDIYRRSIVTDRDDTHYFRAARWFTIGWGAFIVAFASYADLFENLIQAINMIGSVFYGTILGIFFTAFFLPKVKGKAVFWAALVTQALILMLFFGVDRDAYLWYNPLGCGLVMGIGWVWQTLSDQGSAPDTSLRKPLL
ncbi:MAG: sodium:solute symporter [Saprospiraceae bacterium]|nr:sodium:solute symporter [Saprospiraceae bacterium]MDW8228292.1 sodium:solute symporter [Saprospiraceae bacterium]